MKLVLEIHDRGDLYLLVELLNLSEKDRPGPPVGQEETENLSSQIGRLAEFIFQEVPGEPSTNVGAVDTAIRVIRELQEQAKLGLKAEQELYNIRDYLYTRNSLYFDSSASTEWNVENTLKKLSAARNSIEKVEKETS